MFNCGFSRSECEGLEKYVSFSADSACPAKEIGTILLQLRGSVQPCVEFDRLCSEIRRSETRFDARIQNTRKICQCLM
jgi:hypothetical protein